MKDYPSIPYGNYNFAKIRKAGGLYVDKTHFIEPLEEREFSLLIRPRRFGKSLWVSVLESYYDRTRKKEFKTSFEGTYIGENPTKNRNRYAILSFDFSGLNTNPEILETEFVEHCETRLRSTLNRNKDLFPKSAIVQILSKKTITNKLRALFDIAGDEGIPLFVLIDEYDNFANNVLAHHGDEAYHQFTHGDGFFRAFFGTLKAGVKGGIERIFITGVSPIALDDVTSGFNIADNISLNHHFAEMVGFTEPEVRGILESYQSRGWFDPDIDETMDIIREWYDGYRFSRRSKESVFNTDMVLYLINNSVPNDPLPDELIDENVRIDYGKLRHLLITSRKGRIKLNGNFNLLTEVVSKGKVLTKIKRSFPLKNLTKPDNFRSLLYYFGLLSIDHPDSDKTVLRIPNRAVCEFLYGFIRDGLEDADLLSVDEDDMDTYLGKMAKDGVWEDFVAFFAKALKDMSSYHDFKQGEDFMKALFIPFIYMSNLLHPQSEMELNKGRADLVLRPNIEEHPEARYGYIIEFKYLPRSAKKKDKVQGVEEKLSEAKAQLKQYLGDTHLRKNNPGVHFIGLAWVFCGWELVAADAT